MATKTPQPPPRPPASTRSTSSRRAAPRADRTAHKPLAPFTTDHFRAYARLLVLDSMEQWEPEDFQLEVLEDVFAGAPEVWMLVPEGNGKTTLMGGVALYHGDYTPSAEVLMAASSRDQCELLFRQAGGFVTRTPGMTARFRIHEGYRRIRCLRLGGRIQVFAADDRTGDGVIPTLALIDELHRHRDLRLYRTWRGKLEKRGGQLVTISTAGEPGTEFEDTRERVRQEADEILRDGEHQAHVRAVSEHIVLHEWAVPETADVNDLEIVKAANPFTGITLEMLERKRDSPTMTVAHWRRFVCNLPTRSEEAAIQEVEWEAARAGDQDPHQEIPAGEPVWLGLDVAWKWDTTAAVPLWMPTSDFRLLGPAEVMVPPRDGSSLDPHEVERRLLALHDRNPVHTVVMDMSRAEQLATWIEENLGARVVQYSQTHEPARLAYERFTEALRAGRLKHTGDRDLARHVLNAIARLLPSGGARFDRPNASRTPSGQDRRVIDALDAAAMVHAVAAADEDAVLARFDETRHQVPPPAAEQVRALSTFVAIKPGMTQAGVLWSGFDSANRMVSFAELYPRAEEATVPAIADQITLTNARLGIGTEHERTAMLKRLHARTARGEITAAERDQATQLLQSAPRGPVTYLLAGDRRARGALDEAFQQCGIYCLPSQDDRETGILQLRARIDADAWHVSRECPQLLEEIRRWLVARDEDTEREKAKTAGGRFATVGPDHLCEPAHVTAMERVWQPPPAPGAGRPWTPASGTTPPVNHMLRGPYQGGPYGDY